MDIRLIRESPDEARRILALRRCPAEIDRIVTLDARRRKLVHERDSARFQQRRVSEEVGRAKKEKRPCEQEVARARELSDIVKALDGEVAGIESEQAELAQALPNIVHASVTDTEEVVAEWGTQPGFEFTPLAHWDIGAALDIIDLEAAARLAGSRFVVFKGAGALLERALVNYFLDTNVRRHGYTEIAPPVLANAATLAATGQLPHLESEMYAMRDDALFLVPTAEPQLVSFHRGQTIPAPALPVKYVAGTSCFRREAGSYGKDVRGMIRIHQFDKVENVRLVRPDQSDEALEEMRNEAESLLRDLGLAYRVKRLAAWDIAYQSAKTYDLEAWAAGVGRWLEVSSVSNCGDYQTRRGNIRVKGSDGKTFYPHALNGSALALPRVFVAILENYQQSDGSVAVPECLRPYMHGLERIC
ncbi:serine--tRNA ligase [candidate division WOR-3 bacterium]|nr:serine--tRNA ligase [candidate division WOR-3 bacterium]